MRNFLALLVLALVFIRLLRPARRRPAHSRPAEPVPRPQPGVRELVQDPVCHAFVDRSVALTTTSGGQVHYFCSPACYRRFLGDGTATGAA